MCLQPVGTTLTPFIGIVSAYLTKLATQPRIFVRSLPALQIHLQPRAPESDDLDLDGATRVRDLESEFGIEIPAGVSPPDISRMSAIVVSDPQFAAKLAADYGFAKSTKLEGFIVLQR